MVRDHYLSILQGRILIYMGFQIYVTAIFVVVPDCAQPTTEPDLKEYESLIPPMSAIIGQRSSELKTGEDRILERSSKAVQVPCLRMPEAII
jgi:hypothetical protein